jgi:hypothetical protein
MKGCLNPVHFMSSSLASSIRTGRPVWWDAIAAMQLEVRRRRRDREEIEKKR